jgi:Chromo (CHRromatin Organisation MOdifier) domain
MMADRDEALAAHELARTRMAERRQNTFIPFTVGQKVWLDTRNMKTNYHKKMAPKWEGPFEIEEVLGPFTYRLKLPTTWKIHNVFHAVLLKPYVETEVHGKNFSWPIPDILDGEEVYNVETILKHRRRGRSYQYLIKWEGYPISEALWEPEEAFLNDGDLLTIYKQRHQLWDTSHLVKLFKELGNLLNWHCLPCRRREYRTPRYDNSLKQLMISLRGSTSQHVSLFIKTLSLKPSCKKSTTAPPSFSMNIISSKTINNMPRTSAFSTSSSRCSNDSEHFPYRYVDLEHVMDTFSLQENVATAINLADNDRTAFTEIAFLDYLFQNIWWKEKQLEKDRWLARARIARLLSKKSSDQWIINSNIDTPFHLPIGSPHTPPETHTPSSIPHSSHSPEPKPVWIGQHTQSEIDEINHRREFLMQNFPEDQPAGSFANPFTIEDDDDNQEVIVLQRSEDSREGLLLRFARWYTKE